MVIGASWSYYEDRPGKPGWISDPDELSAHDRGGNTAGEHVGRTIVFKLSSNSDKIHIEYLRSYESVGDANVRVSCATTSDFDGREEIIWVATATLKGHWQQGVSQTDASVVQLAPETCRAPGAGNVHQFVEITSVQNSGGKFKLLAISPCE